MDNDDLICISSTEEDENGSSKSSDFISEEDFDDQSGSTSAESADSTDDVDEGLHETTTEKTESEDDRYIKVSKILNEGGDLKLLKLEDCKAYLRKHGLRLTGNKSIYIQRIQEHMNITKKGGQSLYPRSSFSINCRGDVCRGDVVLFSQKVYESYDKASRGGIQTPIGRRTIAGRVVKESYGASKQQHTFTVEVLWSVGVKALPSLHCLLIKGRNLYRMRTYRQPWDNEAEREKVLAEKHKRGTQARNIRAAAKAKYANNGNKRLPINSEGSTSPKRQRVEKPNGRALSEAPVSHNSAMKLKQPCPSKEKRKERTHNATTAGRVQRPASVANDSCRLNYRRKHQVTARGIYDVSGNQNRPQNWFSRLPHRPSSFSYVESNMPPSTFRQPIFHHHQGQPFPRPTHNLHSQPFSHEVPRQPPHTYPGDFFGMHHGYAPNAYLARPGLAPTGISMTRLEQRRKSFSPSRCSFHGCNSLPAKDCVNAACFQCCRRTNTTCRRHKNY